MEGFIVFFFVAVTVFAVALLRDIHFVFRGFLVFIFLAHGLNHPLTMVQALVLFAYSMSGNAKAIQKFSRIFFLKRCRL